jgi:hypothetical protein
MSVRIPETREFGLIAAYARLHGIPLRAGQTPDAFVRDLHAASVKAMLERYPLLSASDIPPLPELPLLNEADGVEVTEAIEMLFYSAEAHLTPELAQDLVAIIRYIEIDDRGLSRSDTLH